MLMKKVASSVHLTPASCHSRSQRSSSSFELFLCLFLVSLMLAEMLHNAKGIARRRSSEQYRILLFLHAFKQFHVSRVRQIPWCSVWLGLFEIRRETWPKAKQSR